MLKGAHSHDWQLADSSAFLHRAWQLGSKKESSRCARVEVADLLQLSLGNDTVPLLLHSLFFEISHRVSLDSGGRERDPAS